MHIKRPKICTCCRVSAAEIYLYHSAKIAKARPHRVECPTDSSVQKQWFMDKVIKNFHTSNWSTNPTFLKSIQENIKISFKLVTFRQKSS